MLMYKSLEMSDAMMAEACRESMQALSQPLWSRNKHDCRSYKTYVIERLHISHVCKECKVSSLLYEKVDPAKTRCRA